MKKTDSDGKVCPLCIENGLMRTKVWEDDEAYLCQRVDFATGTAVVMDNEYMLVPKTHVTEEPDWLAGKARAALPHANVRPDTDYVNRTPEYGRLLEHFHRHYVVRRDSLPVGLNDLIVEAVRLERENSELRAEVAQLRAELAAARREAGLQLNGL